jgi:disulfide bond formation protein DsbB
MILEDFLISLVVTLFVCTMFFLMSRSKTRRTGFGWFLLLVLFATWAGGLWLRPFGLEWGNIQWLQFLASSLLGVLLFTVFAPLKPPQGRHDTLDQLQEIAHEKEINKSAYLTLSMIFWALLLVLLAAIVFRYIIDK